MHLRPGRTRGWVHSGNRSMFRREGIVKARKGKEQVKPTMATFSDEVPNEIEVTALDGRSSLVVSSGSRGG